MSKLIKKAAFITSFAMVVMPALMAAIPASALTAGDVGLGEDDAVTSIGLGNESPEKMAVNVIKIILGFLGLIAVVIILIGGFKWMTAGGNDDKVGEAKKLITAGLIGLVIILSAFGISSFVISNLLTATGTGG